MVLSNVAQGHYTWTEAASLYATDILLFNISKSEDTYKHMGTFINSISASMSINPEYRKNRIRF